MLVVGEQRQVRGEIEGDAGLQARRDIEAALLGEEAREYLSKSCIQMREEAATPNRKAGDSDTSSPPRTPPPQETSVSVRR